MKADTADNSAATDRGTGTERQGGESSPRLLTFGSGGWVLWLAATLVILVGIHRGHLILESLRWRDGKVPVPLASHGFDLEGCLVPPQEIVSSGNTRDFFRPLQKFELASVEEALDKSRTFRKFIANSERVVGVTLGGESRAYPIRILAYHEIIEDQLGGIPIAVTYSPFCDSVVVFDRRLDTSPESAAEPLEFGYSGLLYNSNLLFYDRGAKLSEQSLFSQLRGDALSGALAGRSLKSYPFQLMTWEAWRQRTPDTTTIGGQASYMKKKVYEKDVYGRYHYERDFSDVHYPVKPLPKDPPRPLLSRMLAIYADGAWHEVFHADFAPEPRAQRKIGERNYTFTYEENPECLSFVCDDPAPDLSVIHCYWYAWYAMQRVE